MGNDTTNDIEAAEQPVDENTPLDATDESSGAGGHGNEEFSIVDQLKLELAAAEKRALVAVADLENYRKRANKQIQEQVKYASLNMMSELLESVDNLNRAVEAASQEAASQEAASQEAASQEAASQEAANSALLQGVKMVADQVLNILQAHHCEQIQSVGQPFDPNLHEAVQMQPSDDYPANTVMMEIRTGYKLHDRVIRPAQVFVSTGPGTTG